MRGIIFFAAVFAHARQGDYCVINTYLKVDLYECGRPNHGRSSRPSAKRRDKVPDVGL